MRQLHLLRFDFEETSCANSTRNSGGCLVASGVNKFGNAVASTFLRHGFKKFRDVLISFIRSLFVQFHGNSIIARQAFAKAGALQHSQLIRGYVAKLGRYLLIGYNDKI
jgi:hypothetical protein